MTRRLRVAIDCRIGDPRQGIGAALLALARGLSESNGSDQEYTFVVRERTREWLAPYIFGPCNVICVPDRVPVRKSFSVAGRLRSELRRVAPLRAAWQKLKRPGNLTTAAVSPLPSSDGYVESHQFDVVHFPTQTAYLTKLPSIYQPWDLQHLHYPAHFTEAEIVRRERSYRAFCNQATYVCVQAEWTRLDLINHYELETEKIVVIPWASVFSAYERPSTEEARSSIEKFALPRDFFFYPAVTWPHKNHEIILRALHCLRNDHGIAPHVVFTGVLTDHLKNLKELAHKLGVSEQLHFLGFVNSGELQAIAGAGTAMVFPSKFEGFGLPILEAFHSGLPVLSSNATTLPEIARDGALYFDPNSAEELAGLMKAILEGPELRKELIKRGALALSYYSIESTVEKFKALYEKAAVMPQLSCNNTSGWPNDSGGSGSVSHN